MHMYRALDLCQTGPSAQMIIGPDRVVFDSMVTFTAGGPTEQTVSTIIENDMIALEGDEIVNVWLTIDSPPSGVIFGAIQTTVVTITDDDCKFIIMRQVLFCLEYIHQNMYLSWFPSTEC